MADLLSLGCFFALIASGIGMVLAIARKGQSDS